MIKVDIITGFLGAGKTTFIQNMILSKTWSDEKWVIIENEFGKVGIDGEFLKSSSDISVLEIANGCLCCTLKGDFVDGLAKLIDEQKPDRIIIEPSGIFVLDDLFDLFEEDALSGKCMINSVVTIVDACHFITHISRYNYFLESQIKHASCMVISKTEDAGTVAVLQTIEGLREKNGDAFITAASWESFDFIWFRNHIDQIDYTLENRCFVRSASVKSGSVKSGSVKSASIKSVSVKKLHELSDLTKKGHGIQSFGLVKVQDFTLSRFEKLMLDMGNGLFGEILRMKGYLRIDGNLHKINYVEGTLKSEPTEVLNLAEVVDSDIIPHVEVTAKVSVIGGKLRYKDLTEAFGT